ncbi:MAG: hypothetical protein KKA73_26940 [Chloroflexi bacterium]|nr:hypothetical protein [Chloroflexota bacterium]MBU1751337.1 hypothetical protein [Chloroflexota bacterium]MBU1879315.1 hypothetical protein [Chloroflexota bacterium]
MPRSMMIGGLLTGLMLGLALLVGACASPDAAPTATPVPTPSPTPTGSAGCVGCHTDKDQLKATAAVESEDGVVACKG